MHSVPSSEVGTVVNLRAHSCDGTTSDVVVDACSPLGPVEGRTSA